MLFALAIALLIPSGDPPVKLKVSNDMFMRGDRARVYVKSAQPGYLLVLRADAKGRVRVLFPQDPDDDTYIRAGKQLEVRGRGDRDAFTVDDADGAGKIIAVVSPQPFNTAICRNDARSVGRNWVIAEMFAKTRTSPRAPPA